MDTIKLLVGIAIIIASFVYIIRNKSCMLDNLMRKTREEYEEKQAIQEKAYQVVDGKADAFDAIADGVNAAVKPIKDSVKNKKVNYRE